MVWWRANLQSSMRCPLLWSPIPLNTYQYWTNTSYLKYLTRYATVEYGCHHVTIQSLCYMHIHCLPAAVFHIVSCTFLNTQTQKFGAMKQCGKGCWELEKVHIVKINKFTGKWVSSWVRLSSSNNSSCKCYELTMTKPVFLVIFRFYL